MKYTTTTTGYPTPWVTDIARPNDTENRPDWYAAADQWEVTFCEQVAPVYGLQAQINPAKVDDPKVFDLLVTGKDGNEYLGELKPNMTPFHKAKQLYRVDPSFAFSFNWSDFHMYKPHVGEGVYIFFWVNHINDTTWTDKNGKTYSIEPITMLKVTKLDDVVTFVKENPVFTHRYQRRAGGNGNAKSSMIFDIREMPGKVLEPLKSGVGGEDQ